MANRTIDISMCSIRLIILVCSLLGVLSLQVRSVCPPQWRNPQREEKALRVPGENYRTTCQGGPRPQATVGPYWLRHQVRDETSWTFQPLQTSREQTQDMRNLGRGK